MDTYKTLLNAIKNKTAQIGIIGMGYVGLPLALAFCDEGFNVTGFDVDKNKCASLNQKQTYIKHIPSEKFAPYIDQGRLNASDDFTELKKMDAILICVPTPLNEYREPDLSYVASTAETIAKHGRTGQLIILESSTYPGTTKDILAPCFKTYEDGKDIFLAYSPEREDPSNPNFTTRTIPKVIGADTETARTLSVALYEQIIDDVVPVSSAATAEAVKLTENIFRSINIALVNELKMVYDRMGIDVWEVIEAASTKPFGYMPFYPGPGLGGHCIPIDPFYLTWKAREYEISTRFIELAGEINTHMPYYVVEKLIGGLNDLSSKSLKGSNILIIGMAYKKNVDDDRESPTYKIMDIIEQKGGNTSFYDPHVNEIGATRKYPQFKGRKSEKLDAVTIKKADAVLICTDHNNIDWQLIADNAKVIIDTRNVMAQHSCNRVIKA